MSKWFVPCDKCGKKWVVVDCEARRVYDELTMGGKPVIDVERTAREARRELGAKWTKEDADSWGVDMSGKYIKPTVKMPRMIVKYDRVICEECRGSKKKMEKVE